MALLADDELDALHVQMAHTAAVAAKPQYPLAPTVAPKEPTWVDSAGGGYYDDGLGHYSNNGGASWDYTPPASTYPLAPSYAPPVAAPVDPYGYDAPYVTPDTAPADWGGSPSWPTYPTQQDFVGIDRAMDTTSGAGQGFFSGTTDPYAQYRDQWATEGRIDPYDPRINPETAREAAYGSASSGGNPFTVVATGGLQAAGVPFAKPLGTAIGTLADAATFGAGSGMAGGNEDVTSKGFWGEAGMAAGNAGFFGLGGGLVRNAAANVGANLAGEYIPKGLETYSKSGNVGAGIAGNPYVQAGGGLLGAIAAGVGGYGAAGAAVGAAKRAPGAVKAADRALTGLDAKLMEPAGSFGGQATDAGMVFSKGQRAGAERTVIPDSAVTDMAAKDTSPVVARLNSQRAQAIASGDTAAVADIDTRLANLLRNSPEVRGAPQPLANERLWFHSTRDMTYDLPDPDLAVGTQTGITQGPGIYMAADPAKSAGNYGPRTFVAEFDGTTLDLTAPADAAQWSQIRQTIADRLRAGYGDDPNYFPDTEVFSPRALAAKGRSELKTADNGYAYRDALVNAVRNDIADEWNDLDWQQQNTLLGRFKAAAEMENPDVAAQAIVQDAIASNGVDALFHHSPRADGDVLIVLNGEKARTVADVKNAPDAVKQGATLKDIKRGATSKIVESAGERASAYAGVTWRTADGGAILGSKVGNPRSIWIELNDRGLYQIQIDGQKRAAFSSLEDAKHAAAQELTGRYGPQPPTSIRTFGSRINDETGALDMGAVGERFGEAGKRAARIFADAAEKEGRPTSGGIFDMLAPTERAGTGLVRRYEGAVGTAGLELRTDLDVGNRLLREAKQPGNWDGTRFVAKRTPEMEQLFKALHGEGQPPASLQKVYDAIKPMVEKESAATIDFDKAFVPRDDYFYRGWKEVPVGKAQNAGTGKGQFGAKPGFMKPRSDQSFSDILNSVYTKPDGSQVKLEPVSWNPFEMAAIRKTAGEQFRAQGDLLAGLKETGMAVSADVAPDGWRVPRVGPAFEGKPFAFTPTAKDTGPMSRLADEGSAAVGYTKRIAVPDKIANDIESIFGRQADFGQKMDAVLSFGQKAKQSKLLLSLFQQMDFGARTLGALNAGVIDELAETVGKAARLQPGPAASHLVAAGRKFMAIPKDLAELPLANVSGAAQRRLRAGILDAKPIYKERPGITLKGVSEAGGKFGTDISLVTRDIMADIAKQPKPAYLTTGVVGRRIRQVNAASQRGLFDGWYVQAQSTALKKTILPRIMRQHPDWTDAQIMAGGADEVNKMFSTLGEYQTAIKNPAVKKLARGLIFSTNETEALLRGAASTVVGPNKRLWTEFYLGTFLGLATIAETVHYATTGEHLPVERLNPIDTENNYGPLPVGYRTNFLAPDIPIKGRNNTNLTLDTVMQMDTIFRLLDPKAFVGSRENVLPRTITNQVTGKDFYGRPLKGPKDRITQAAIDLAEPIGMGNLRAATGFGPDSESRIGTAGALLQTAGANVRAENNAQLKDRLAVEWAAANGVTKPDGSPIKGWDDIELSQRPDVLDANPAAKAELEKRGEEAATLGQASGYASQTTATITRQQEESDKRLGSRDISPGQWVDDYRGRVDESRIRKDEIYRESKTKPGGNQILDGYFGALDTAKLPDGNIDWDAVDAYRASLSPTDNAYIDRNTGLSINTPVVKLYRDTTNNLDQTGYYDLRDKAWEEFKAKDPSRLGSLPDYWTWRDGELKEIIGKLEADGADPRLAGQMAAAELAKYKAVKAFSEFYRTEFRHQWVVDNPELAKTAVYFGLFDPDAAEEKFLGMRK